MPASADDAWAPGPLRPQLTEGAVHVWRADLSEVAKDMTRLLSSDELERGARVMNGRDGELWRRSRGLLRELLGRYLQRDPSSLRFVVGEHGKPALLGHPWLSFNMSHSSQLALYAFSATGAVGVDVEVARRATNEVAIAESMLGVAEARRLEALDPDPRRREFLRAWARHEAELKCLGVGIGGAPTDGARSSLWVAELELCPEAGAAVAVERPVHDLRRWDWARAEQAASQAAESL
jgi:4'-phosphopantetheinyl transferase